jgi:hypothetical protein
MDRFVGADGPACRRLKIKAEGRRFTSAPPRSDDRHVKLSASATDAR